MTTESAHSGDDPRRLLSSTRELAERVRREQRATWFPLRLSTASWNLVPQLVTGGTVLLLGGISFALAQRPLRSPVP
jgi:hypothetical protein